MTPAFNPMPIEDHIARYPAAVADILAYGSRPKIAENPKHRFDFDDGLRLVIGRDGPNPGGQVVITTELAPDGSLLRQLLAGSARPLDVMLAVQSRYRKLSGDTRSWINLAFDSSPALCIARHQYRFVVVFSESLPEAMSEPCTIPPRENPESGVDG